MQTKEKDILVSTVFLGVDHGIGEGDPILFETMVFDKSKSGMADELDGYTQRYCNYAEAEQGHQEILDKVRAKK